MKYRLLRLLIVLCSFGIMTYSAQQTINLGTVANDGTGDPARTAFGKCNSNFTELYSTTSTNTTNISTNTTSISTINALKHAINVTFDGQGSAITAGSKVYFSLPYACTITAATMVADVSGSAVLDIWKDTYANYPPTITDSIVASAPPTISAATKSSDTSLSGWTGKSVSAGDTFVVNVTSASTITKLNLVLSITTP